MSRYWNQRVKELSPYVPGEQPKGETLIKLNTNENPYPPSPRVLEALAQAVAGSLRLYPDPACTALREAAAARYGLGVENVFAGNGSDEILAFAFAAFFEAGSPVLFPDITYSFYPVYAGLWGLPYRTEPLGDDFTLDPAPYTAPSGGVVFPNPNAPTGRALTLDAIERIARAQARHGAVFVLDEAYIDFASSPGVKTGAGLIKDNPNLLVVRTLSKSASLAGLRAGFALADTALIEALCRVRDSFNSYTLDRLAQAGAAAALSDIPYYERTTAAIIATRERVSAALAQMGHTVIPSQANFLFVKPSHLSGRQLFTSLRESGILTRRFDKPRISDFLRVSIGTDTDMDRFLTACRHAAETTGAPSL